MRDFLRTLVGLPAVDTLADDLRVAQLEEQRAASALQVGALLRADHQISEEEWDALACRYSAAVQARRQIQQERVDTLPHLTQSQAVAP